MQLVQSCYIIKENKALPEDPEDPGDRHGEVIFNNKIGKGQGGIMSDAYVECLVKQKQAGIWKVLRVFLIVLAVLFLLATLFTLLGIVCFILAIVAAVGSYLVNLFTDLEFEYIYVDKELSVDKVMAKSRRKRVATYSLDRVEAFGPVKSYHLDQFRNRNVKTIDYSIGEELQPDRRYALYYEGGIKLLMSPSEELVKVMKNAAPRKVFTD